MPEVFKLEHLWSCPGQRQGCQKRRKKGSGASSSLPLNEHGDRLELRGTWTPGVETGLASSSMVHPVKHY